MLFDFQHDIQIARRPAIGSGLSFTGDTQPRSGIHARWNAQLDGFFALEASLPAALLAAFLHNLTRTLARRARARDGEEPLLIGNLATPSASLAGLNAGAFFRAAAVAGLAEFLSRQFNLGGYACGGFFERERHVVAQIGATLSAAAPATRPAASKQVLETKEISKNVMEILEDGVVKTLTGAAGKTGMTVSIVNLPLLRIAEHAVGFGAFAELYFRLGFIFRTAVRMPLQRRFAVGGLDFVDRRGARHAQNFVVISLIPLGHGNDRSPLVDCFLRCGTGMHGYTHHGGAQHASIKHISRLKNLQDGALFVVHRLSTIHCLMQVRIE